METIERVAAKAGDPSTRCVIAAHHEAGHIVVAAAMGLRLRPEGIMVDADGDGLACFHKQPDGSDESKERVILATLAGYRAQKQFCEEAGHGCPLPDDIAVTWSQDSKEARGIEGKLSDAYLSGRGVGLIHEDLEQRAAALVSRHWPAITAVARALSGKDLEPIKPLRSGVEWSRQVSARCLGAEEIREILAEFGIQCVCGVDS